MTPFSSIPQFSRFSVGQMILAGMLCFSWSLPVLAQEPDCPPDQGVILPEKQRRPAKGPGSLSEFVDHLSKSDAMFEVVVGQGRILTTKADFAIPGKAPALIAVGDPSVIDFVIINSRQIRIIGQRVGVTDLSITTGANQTYTFEVRVVADLGILLAQLHKNFPDASVKLSQIRDHVIVEGQARDSGQVARIIETVKAYLHSVEIGQARKTGGAAGPRVPATKPGAIPPPKEKDGKDKDEEDKNQPGAAPETQARSIQAAVTPPQVINLLRVPGTRQVMLKVRVAELNRTALRQIGTDILVSSGGTTVGTRIGGNTVNATASGMKRLLAGAVDLSTGGGTTLFGVFENADFALFFNALRRNSLLKILAEPNLVALHGHQASFLAGGEFPVPVPQSSSGGAAPTVTVQFREFGVKLAFLPHILDGDIIRLAVDPEVSSIDFTLGTVLVPGGTPVPGLNTRKAHTVVEMKEGQTLAIAGLLQVSLDGTTNRLPGLGDLPVLGPFFSNTSGQRIEKELIVMVTPCLVEPMNCDQVPPGPGDEVKEPTDLELYLGNRIEGRTGRDFRSTVNYESRSPLLRCLLRLENQNVRGPHGFCD
jgi:pilus assembly protein CpaC